MGDKLEELASRYQDLYNKTLSGSYHEISRLDLYRDMHYVAKRLLALEDAVERHIDDG